MCEDKYQLFGYGLVGQKYLFWHWYCTTVFAVLNHIGMAPYYQKYKFRMEVDQSEHFLSQMHLVLQVGISKLHKIQLQFILIHHRTRCIRTCVVFWMFYTELLVYMYLSQTRPKICMSKSWYYIRVYLLLFSYFIAGCLTIYNNSQAYFEEILKWQDVIADISECTTVAGV